MVLSGTKCWLETLNISVHFIIFTISRLSELVTGDTNTEIMKILQNSLRQNKQKAQGNELSKNRYSVLYTLKGQYQHVGCSSQEEAQHVLGTLQTDGHRIPIGIYDSQTDTFEWEIIGQYFHAQDSAAAQQERLHEVLTVARSLRRRDGSWQPGVLGRASFFA
ncbi:hypothetical protein [Dyadobacter sp.]|uniref:hypothetical protein n=1 Tax=Dyadobacter sp. TaxID=1914288 RepID=UPI003F718483